MVSIIIPTFNRASLIAQTLDSIKGQTHTNWECLIIDDGSSDNTREVVQHFISEDARFQYHLRPGDRPKGANACRNYGLELSSGTFINWFDSDDLMHPEKLAIQLEGLESLGMPFSVCQSEVFEGHPGNIIGLKHDTIRSGNAFDDFVSKKIVWLTQAPLFRKAIFDQNTHLRFNETLQASQEWEFFSRILFQFPHYHAEDRALVLLRHHTDSISYKPEFVRLRRQNYLKARAIIYQLAKSNTMSPELELFFARFFYDTFKERVEARIFKEAFYIYHRFLLPQRLLTTMQKAKLFLALSSFYLAGKGEKLLKIKI